MAATDTRNAVTIPITRTVHSEAVNPKPDFKSLRALAPSIMGIARKNENSAEVFLEHPRSVAPIMVEPLLDVPGISARS